MFGLGRRVAAFGYMAGFTGSAVGIDVWCHQKTNAGKVYGALTPYPNENVLIDHIKSRLAQAGKCFIDTSKRISFKAFSIFSCLEQQPIP